MRTLPLIVTFIRYALESNGCRSSLIQSGKFSERPRIVPPEVYMPQRCCTGSLAEDGKWINRYLNAPD